MIPEVFLSGLFFASIIIMLVGFMSIIFPFLPSVLVIWLGVFLYAVGSSFETIDANFMLVVSVLAFGTMFLDYLSNSWGSRKFRGSYWGVLGAVLGGLVGSLFGPLGMLVIGPVFGAVIFEMVRGRDNIFGIETDHFTVVGFIGGTLVKLATGVVIVGLFIWKLMQSVST
ncbi:MAG: DUF456 domain-containing protein [Candidatus Kerfeldbacteria bacterium]